MIIKANNTLTVNSPQTFLASAYSSGGTSLPVKNINAFQASWAVQLGKTGEEQSEIMMLDTGTPAGTVLETTGTTVYDHPQDTPVYATKYDQIIFKRSTAGTSGTATAMTGGTVTITPDYQYTQFDDTSGATTYAYKASYRNSVSAEVSSDSGWLTPSGYTFHSRIKIRDRIKNKLYNVGFIKNDAVIDDWINEWYEEMNNKAIKANEDYSMGTVDITFGTSGLGTITSTDFKKIRRIWITYDGTRFEESTKLDTTDVLPEGSYSTGSPQHVYRDDTVFQIVPPSAGGTARIDYYQTITPFTNDTDELPNVMQSYTKSFVDYGVSQAYYMDSKDSSADRFMGFAEKSKADFITEITPRDHTGVQYIEFEEDLSAN